MAKREDGKETQHKLLNAACEIFAEKGYRNAKIADICKLAGANVASVNYYFGDKANLYKEAWRHALETFEEPVFSDDPDISPEDILRGYITMLMQNITKKGKLGQFSRLYLMELVNPTGLIKDSWHEVIEPRKKRFREVIRNIIGRSADELTVRCCELSIISQCRALVTMKRSDLEHTLNQPLNEDFIKHLTKHIIDFSLAGIKAAGNQTCTVL